MADAPIFIDTDQATIISELVTYYEAQTGRTLYPAQVERLIINMIAYREGLLRQGIQDAALQNLVDFSRAPYLDYLGALLDVERLPAGSAIANFTATLVSGHSGVTIPAGTRIASVDGLVIFKTLTSVSAAVGINTVYVDGEAQNTGESGNGYVSGAINNILDPLPYLSALVNNTTTAGGSEQEVDDLYRERIKLASSKYSTAGSRGAYAYYARSVSSSIIDVAVLGPPDTIPGTVECYPLMADGSATPSPIIDSVLAALSAETVRPLTDTINVISPTAVNYTITVDVTLYDTADVANTISGIESALDDFVLSKRQKLGRDVIYSQIVGVCQIDGVYSAVPSGWTDLIIGKIEYAFCTNITVNYLGSVNG